MLRNRYCQSYFLLALVSCVRFYQVFPSQQRQSFTVSFDFCKCFVIIIFFFFFLFFLLKREESQLLTVYLECLDELMNQDTRTEQRLC